MPCKKLKREKTINKTPSYQLRYEMGDGNLTMGDKDMKKHIAPEGAINRYKVTRISTGSITEVAYITARDEDEAEEKLSNDELDSDFETMDDDMSVEEENITLCKSEEKEHA